MIPVLETITVEVVREIEPPGRWIIRTTVMTSDGNQSVDIKDCDPVMFDYDGYWKHTWDKMGEDIKRHLQKGRGK